MAPPTGTRLCLSAAMVPRRSAPLRGGEGGAQGEVGEAVRKPAPERVEISQKRQWERVNLQTKKHKQMEKEEQRDNRQKWITKRLKGLTCRKCRD